MQVTTTETHGLQAQTEMPKRSLLVDLQLLTESEVCEILKCTKSGLRKWRREGNGPKFVRVEGMIRYQLAAIIEYIEKNTVGRRRP